MPQESRYPFTQRPQGGERLKTLRGLTPPEFVCAQWQINSAIFTRDPTHLTLGIYI